MNQTLQDAVAATRAGNKTDAQRLLVQNLKENPDDVQSWFLLSLLVDSEEKQVAYLNKTLALDPSHEKAQLRLAKLQTGPEKTAEAQIEPATTTAMPISDEPLDFVAQAQGDTLPDWLAGETDSLQLDKVVSGEAQPEADQGDAAALPAEDEDVPDWLQEDVSDAWVNQEPPTQISTAPPREAVATSVQEAPEAEPKAQVKRRKRRKTKPRTKQEETTRLNIMLGILIVIAVIIFVLLIYTLFNQV